MLDCSQNWTSKAKMNCQSPPEFVRSVTPIGTRVGRFCPSHYCQPPRIQKATPLEFSILEQYFGMSPYQIFELFLVFVVFRTYSATSSEPQSMA